MNIGRREKAENWEDLFVRFDLVEVAACVTTPMIPHVASLISRRHRIISIKCDCFEAVACRRYRTKAPFQRHRCATVGP